MMTKVQAQYIKQIFEFQEAEQKLTNKSLSQALGVSAPSSSEMVKKLRQLGFVEEGEIVLTEKGETLARNLVSKHRIWETFLIDHLGYGWEEVHEDAEMLESVVGDRLYERLNNRLGRPKRCPHGKPIYINSPSKKDDIPLDEGGIGKEYIIASVKDDMALLNYLNEKNIALGDRITILKRNPYDYCLSLKVKDHETTISEKATHHIRIRKI